MMRVIVTGFLFWSSLKTISDKLHHHQQPPPNNTPVGNLNNNDFLRENRCHWRQRTPPRYLYLLFSSANLPGRLASTVAKQILNGQHIVVVRCEDLNISGEFFRNKLKFHAYLRKRCRYNPTRVWSPLIFYIASYWLESRAHSISALRRGFSIKLSAAWFHAKRNGVRLLWNDWRCSRVSHRHMTNKRGWSCHKHWGCWGWSPAGNTAP